KQLALPYMGPASRCRFRWTCTHELGRIEQLVGRNSNAKSIHRAVQAIDDRARYAGLDGGPYDRRSRLTPEFGRSQRAPRFSQGAKTCARCLQRPKADTARLGPAIASAHSAHRQPDHRLYLAAVGFPAPVLGT